MAAISLVCLDTFSLVYVLRSVGLLVKYTGWEALLGSLARVVLGLGCSLLLRCACGVVQACMPLLSPSGAGMLSPLTQVGWGAACGGLQEMGLLFKFREGVLAGGPGGVVPAQAACCVCVCMRVSCSLPAAAARVLGFRAAFPEPGCLMRTSCPSETVPPCSRAVLQKPCLLAHELSFRNRASLLTSQPSETVPPCVRAVLQKLRLLVHEPSHRTRASLRPAQVLPPFSHPKPLSYPEPRPGEGAPPLLLP